MNFIKGIIAAGSCSCNLMLIFSSLGGVFDPVPDPNTQSIVSGIDSFSKAGLSAFTESTRLILI
jgi:hypothetical protein